MTLHKTAATTAAATAAATATTQISSHNKNMLC
jgi:hypothetical protein